MVNGDETIIVSGLGHTRYLKRSDRSVLRMAAEAVTKAARDAGIGAADLDGLFVHPGSVVPDQLAATLGMDELAGVFVVPSGGSAAVASLGHARSLVLGGDFQNIAIVRSRNGSSERRVASRVAESATTAGCLLERAYNIAKPVQWSALACRAYMERYGLSRQQLGSIALMSRRNAQLNPNAQMRNRELTMSDYLRGRTIADPLTLFDCCVETDAAACVIVSRLSASVPRSRHARVIDVKEASPPSPDSYLGRRDILEIGLATAADRLWNSVGMEPTAVDVAMIYDPFTFQVLHQLEAAKLVPEGESGRFAENGWFGIGGRLPVNTHGGLLSEGHVSGLNHVVEAVRQLRGEAGRRQVVNCRRVVVTGWSDRGVGSIALLGEL